MFKAADRNHNAQIDFVEFLQMNHPRVTREMGNKLMARYGGALYKEEAEDRRQQAIEQAARKEKARLQSERELLDEHEIRLAFKGWLRGGKETISIGTLRNHCPEIEKQVVQDWLDQTGTNQQLTCDEFVALCSHHYSKVDAKQLRRLARKLHEDDDKP